MDCIRIRSIEFYAFHGVSEDEQSVGHRYLVDVDLRTEIGKAGASDQLEDTVDYSRVAKRVVQIGTGAQFRLLEALAERMSQSILDEFSVPSVKLWVRKKCPPMSTIAEDVGVEI